MHFAMSSFLRRLAPAFLICSLLSVAGRVAALPDGRAVAANLGVFVENGGALLMGRSWADPVPGTKAYVGLLQRGFLDVGKRDCLPNGTNYCFGDTENFCSACGTCCVDGLYCCGAGGTCCGTGCCASGQTCDKGQCSSPVTAVTVTSISYQTVSHVATQVATVVVVVVDTSTVLSTTEITVSSAATQTNIVYVTSTFVAKRAVATAESGQLGKKDAGDVAAAVKRQATQPNMPVDPPSTVTRFITQTTDVTRVVSTTITSEDTSTSTITILRTQTKVLNAQTTIDITSTVTITKGPPTTMTITKTENPIPGPTEPASPDNPDPSAAPVTDGSSSSLQTGAIIGIAVGGAVAAIAIIAALIFFIRRRRNKKQPFEMDDYSSPPGDMRQPTYPIVLPQFANTAPAHHAEQFHPPKTSPGINQFLVPDSGTPPGHQRSSSGFTTLVGSAHLGAGAAKKGDRHSTMTATSGRTVAEVPGSQPADWYEVDGNSPVPSPNPNPSSPPLGSGSPPQQHYRQASYGDQPPGQGPRGAGLSQGYFQGLPGQQQQQSQGQQGHAEELDSVDNTIAELGEQEPHQQQPGHDTRYQYHLRRD